MWVGAEAASHATANRKDFVEFALCVRSKPQTVTWLRHGHRHHRHHHHLSLNREGRWGTCFELCAALLQPITAQTTAGADF